MKNENTIYNNEEMIEFAKILDEGISCKMGGAKFLDGTFLNWQELQKYSNFDKYNYYYLGIKNDKIERFTFAFCDDLVGIVIPDRVKIIEPYSFFDCKNLQFIIIPDSIKEIDWDVIQYCEKLNSKIIEVASDCQINRPSELTKRAYNKSGFFDCTPIFKNKPKEGSLLWKIRALK